MGLSVGEEICMDFGKYLKNLEQEGRCLFLPFKIEVLNLKNIAKSSERNVEFGTSFNVIFGYVGSGKTTLMKAIASVSGSQSMVKNGQHQGQINMTLSDGSVLHQDIFNPENVHCVVLDDAGERLDQEHYCEFLRYLSGLNIQLILLLSNMDDGLKRQINMIFPNCRFIPLN